jgi:hypothetical protein
MEGRQGGALVSTYGVVRQKRGNEGPSAGVWPYLVGVEGPTAGTLPYFCG